MTWWRGDTENIYDEIMTKHLRWSLDKTYTMKPWQSIYEEIMTKHLRWSFDKVFTKKSWQSVYEEIMTKHLRLVSMQFDKTYTKNLWQKIYDEILTKSWQSIYEEVMTKHIRRSLYKVFTFKFDKVLTKCLCLVSMKFWHEVSEVRKHVKKQVSSHYFTST